MQHILASYTILCSPSHLPRLKVLLLLSVAKKLPNKLHLLPMANAAACPARLPDCQPASLPGSWCGRGRGRVFWKPSRRLRRADLRQAPRLALASNLTAECADGCDSQDKTFGSCQERVFTCSQKCTAHRPLHPAAPFHSAPAALAQAKQPVTLFGCLTSSD